MKTLSDKFVVDPEPLDESMKHERERKLSVSFEKRAREVFGVHILKDKGQLNPLSAALEGVRL